MEENYIKHLRLIHSLIVISITTVFISTFSNKSSNVDLALKEITTINHTLKKYKNDFLSDWFAENLYNNNENSYLELNTSEIGPEKNIIVLRKRPYKKVNSLKEYLVPVGNLKQPETLSEFYDVWNTLHESTYGINIDFLGSNLFLGTKDEYKRYATKVASKHPIFFRDKISLAHTSPEIQQEFKDNIEKISIKAYSKFHQNTKDSQNKFLGERSNSGAVSIPTGYETAPDGTFKNVVFVEPYIIHETDFLEGDLDHEHTFDYNHTLPIIGGRFLLILKSHSVQKQENEEPKYTILPIHIEFTKIQSINILNQRMESNFRDALFDESFPYLSEASSKYTERSISLSDLENVLIEETGKKNTNLKLIGVEIPTNMLINFGIPIILLMQIYFTLHLNGFISALQKTKSNLINLYKTPWIGVYSDSLLSWKMMYVTLLAYPYILYISLLVKIHNQEIGNEKWILVSSLLFNTIITYTLFKSLIIFRKLTRELDA